jgi:hypothetical protein
MPVIIAYDNADFVQANDLHNNLQSDGYNTKLLPRDAVDTPVKIDGNDALIAVWSDAARNNPGLAMQAGAGAVAGKLIHTYIRSAAGTVSYYPPGAVSVTDIAAIKKRLGDLDISGSTAAPPNTAGASAGLNLLLYLAAAIVVLIVLIGLASMPHQAYPPHYADHTDSAYPIERYPDSY